MNQYDKQHQANVRKYQRKIDAIYKKAAEQAAARAATLPAPDDYIFTFDDFPAVKKQIDALMATMRADIELTVADGVRTEWDLANEKNDALVNSVLGDAAKLARYHRTHEDALNAFLERKQNGLGLSDRVWRYTNQFKSEIEMGLDLGIREGMDAASIARSIQQYLQYPDMLFRRVKDEHGIFQLSQRAAAFHPGQGVYRSSYKNALRLAATETNIAYRTSDHERWQDLDFVVGIEVHLSNNHTILNHKKERVPLVDICDELQGRYPKEFKFVGWHPNCRCIAVTINKTKEEVKADLQRIRNGEPPSDPSTSENYVKDMPDGFTQWMQDNAERIERAKSLPYFIRDNFKDGDPSHGLRWVVEKPLTPAEIRHMNRTPEREQELRDWWKAREDETRLMKLAANNMLKVAADYGEVDASKLAATLADVHDLNVLQRETKALAQQVLAMKKQEQALADLIPDVHTWHQQFTIAELQTVHGAVESKLAQWSTLTLEQQAKKLQFEAVDFLGGNMKGVQQKYPTWKVSQSAYLKQLDAVNYKLEIQAVNIQLNEIETWLASHPKSAKVASLLQDAKDAIAAGEDIANIKAKAQLAEIDYKKRLAAQKYRDKKKLGQTISPSFDADAYSQKRKDAAMWAKNTADADARLRDKCGFVWRNASKAERDAIHGYTSSYHNINEPLRGLTYIGSAQSTRTGLARIPHITEIISRSSYDFDMWLQRGDSMVALKKFGLANYATATDAEIKALVGATGTEGAFWSAGVAKGKGFGGNIIFNIYAPKGTKAMYCEPFSAFGNGAGRAWDGIAKQSSFGYESEILLQRGTTFRITKVEKAAGTWFIDVDIIAQDVLPFPYQGGFPYK